MLGSRSRQVLIGGSRGGELSADRARNAGSLRQSFSLSRQMGARERAVIGRAGKARSADMARAMASIRNAASVVEGGSIGCAARSPDR
jgi:hypothetical protein